jgi:hypothetical protein
MLTFADKAILFFRKIEALEHPRFIMQYRLKQKQFYIDNYIEKLNRAI